MTKVKTYTNKSVKQIAYYISRSSMSDYADEIAGLVEKAAEHGPQASSDGMLTVRAEARKKPGKYTAEIILTLTENDLPEAEITPIETAIVPASPQEAARLVTAMIEKTAKGAGFDINTKSKPDGRTCITVMPRMSASGAAIRYTLPGRWNTHGTVAAQLAGKIVGLSGAKPDERRELQKLHRVITVTVNEWHNSVAA